MKISDLINQLKKIQLEYGDLECATIKHDPYDFELYLIDPNIEVIDNPCGDGKILMIEED